MPIRGTSTSTLARRGSLAHDLMLTSAFAALTGIAAQVSLRLPFTPVPVTGQVFLVILSGLMLGSRLGALSQLQYLLAGLGGLPVFAHFMSGPAAVMGPDGGYLLGFVAGAWVVGFIRERVSARGFGGALAVSAGIAAIYAFGVAHLALFVMGDVKKAFLLGAAPFIGVDICKAILALGASGAVARATRRL